LVQHRDSTCSYADLSRPGQDGPLPLPWHLRAWNASTCSFIGCLVMFIHALIWKDHAVNIAPVWCDICKFILRACVASSPDDMLDSIQVYSWRRHWDTCFGFVLDSSFVLDCMYADSVCHQERCAFCLRSHIIQLLTYQQKRRALFVDVGISLGIPILVMILREPSPTSPALPSLTRSQTSWCRAIDLIYSKMWGSTHSRIIAARLDVASSAVQHFFRLPFPLNSRNHRLIHFQLPHSARAGNAASDLPN
jgi:hypothetical protein